MYGKDILCGISKGTLEIPRKLSCPYIERDDFYSILNIQELTDLRACKRFWNAPWTSKHINNQVRVPYTDGDNPRVYQISKLHNVLKNNLSRDLITSSIIIVWLAQGQWSDPEWYGEIDWHGNNTARNLCIILGQQCASNLKKLHAQRCEINPPHHMNYKMFWLGYYRNALNTLRPRQTGRRFRQATFFICMFLNEI